MVKSMAKAIRIQQVRCIAGKKGIARSVRRFFKRSTTDWYGYNELKQQVPFIEFVPEIEFEEVPL